MPKDLGADEASARIECPLMRQRLKASSSGAALTGSEASRPTSSGFANNRPGGTVHFLKNIEADNVADLMTYNSLARVIQGYLSRTKLRCAAGMLDIAQQLHNIVTLLGGHGLQEP